MTNRKLEVGDRVRVYDGSRIFGGKVIEGKESPNFPGGVWLISDPDSDGRVEKVLYHRKQIRFLKQKQPAERVGRLVANMDIGFRHEQGWTKVVPGYEETYIEVKTIRMTELRENERIVSRDSIAEAWSQAFLGGNGTGKPFYDLCKALGFSEQGSGG